MTQQWDGVTLANTLKTVAAEQGLKFPQLAMPLRLCLTGSTQTPSVDALLQVLGAELVLTRLQTLLANYPA
jgi:glutamyl-tRNA synthetase